MSSQEYSMVPFYSLKLVREKGIRYPVSKAADSYSAAEAIRAYLQDKDVEHLVVMLLDGNHHFIGLNLVSIGQLSAMQASVRDVMKHAIVGRASGIILGHNHASGDVTPSPQDIAFTEAVRDVGKMMGVTLLDHIIISSGMDAGNSAEYYSFSNEGMLE